MKKILAIILTIITIFSLVSVSSYALVTDADNIEVSKLNVPLKTTNKDVNATYTVSYANENMITEEDAGVIIPVEFKYSGTFYISYNALELGKGSYLELFADETLSTTVGYSEIISSSSLVGTHDIDIPKAGVYYLVVYTYTSEYTDPYVNTIDLSVYYTSNADRTLKSNTWSNACYKETGTYYKFSIEKDCVVNVISNHNEIYVKLYNSKKKVVSEYKTKLSLDNNFTTSYYLEKGTYYFLVDCYNDGDYQIKYKTASISTLKNNKFTKFYQADSTLYMYVKLTPKSSGYIKVSYDNYYGNVTLCNSKKKAISNKDYITSDTGEYSIFGVEKGKTYYIRLQNSNRWGKVKYTNTALKDSGGAKKAKATKMAEKKWIGGYVAAGNSSKDWFKFSVSSPKYAKIDIKGAVHDKLKITVYDSDGTMINYFNFYDFDTTKRIYTYSKLKKGTYYVSVERGSKLSSGYYSLKLATSNKSFA